MTVRYTLEHRTELVQDFALAAEQRFFEMQGLLAAGHYTGAVYLGGYVAEMLLKSACLRWTGARPNMPAGAAIGPVLKWAKRHLPEIDPEQKHSLRFWLSVLRAKRRPLSPWPHDFDSELLKRVLRLHHSWKVTLRYYPHLLEPTIGRAVLDDVAWLRAHQQRLWR